MAGQKRLTRHNVLLFNGDMDALQRLHPLKASLIIRCLVRRFISENKPLTDEELVSIEEPIHEHYS